jgi:hypothetical protein
MHMLKLRSVFLKLALPAIFCITLPAWGQETKTYSATVDTGSSQCGIWNVVNLTEIVGQTVRVTIGGVDNNAFWSVSSGSGSDAIDLIQQGGVLDPAIPSNPPGEIEVCIDNQGDTSTVTLSISAEQITVVAAF